MSLAELLSMRGMALALLGVLALVAIGPVSAAADGPGDVPALGAVNRIDARRTSSVDVRIPAGGRLSLRPFGNPSIRFDGGGRIVALSLVKLPIRADSPQWVASTWPWCPGISCKKHKRATVVAARNWPTRMIEETELNVPAGRYRVYTMTTKPMKVTLRFRGLGGRAVLVTERRTSADVIRRDVPVTTDPLDATLDVASISLDAPGVFVTGATVRSADGNYGAYVLNECFSKIGVWSPDPGEAWPLPGECEPDLAQDFGGPSIKDEMWRFQFVGAGEYISGLSWLRASHPPPVRRLTAYSVWLSYD